MSWQSRRILNILLSFSRTIRTSAVVAIVALSIVGSLEVLAEEDRAAGESSPALTQAPDENIPRVEILTPTHNGVLPSRSVSIILSYTLGADVDLRVNNQPVDQLLIGRTEEDATSHMVTQYWYGVVLEQGTNTITARATIDGVKGPESTVQVMVPDKPQSLSLKTRESRIPADGTLHRYHPGSVSGSQWECVPVE